MGVGELVGVAGTLAVGELAVVAVVVAAEVVADGLVGGPTEPIRLPPLRISVEPAVWVAEVAVGPFG